MLTSTCEQPYLQAIYDAAGGVLDAPLASLATDWNKVSITIRGIRDDITNPDVKLSSILLKAKVMAYSLDVPEFKQWIERELEGYEGEDVEVPDYRKAAGTNFGQFSGYGGAWIDKQGIPVSHLPEAVRERYGTFQLREGIPAIETTIESLTQNNKFEMRAPWAAEAVAMVSKVGRIVEGYALVAAWQAISKNFLESVQHTVRNRMLTFVLELENRFPETIGSEEAISRVPSEQTQNIFQTYVLGGQNVMASGTGFVQQAHTNVQENDIDSLLHYMRVLNVSDEDVDELREAIGEDETPPDRGTFGSRVAGWIGKMTQKSLEGAWMTSSNVGVQALIDAISRYYGQN